MKEHKFDLNTFIGGWYINPKVCDNLVEYFNNNKDLIKPGIQGSKGYKYLNKDEKESFEICIDINKEVDNCILDYGKELNQVIELYQKKYDYVKRVAKFNIVENFNIQYYKPKGGYKVWHSERQTKSSSERLLVFMTYLNDVKNGGTEFYYQKLKTPAKKGLTLIWPAEWTHTHKGQISKTQEKYIVTGWYGFI
tara:strand:- start:54 stop:635 length:582 start_codon:yes stop_codon:yes gene_type:complete